MLALRAAHRTTITRTGSGIVPLCRNLSIAASRRTGPLRPLQRLGVSPTLGVSGSRSLSLWWGQSRPESSATLPTTPTPDALPGSEPINPAAAASSNPAVEITQVEPNVIPSDLVSSTPSITDTLLSEPVAHQMGDFAAQGFGGWTPSGMVQASLEFLHVQTGLPWWASIIVVTALVRTAVLPLNLRLMGNASRLARVQPQFTALTEQVKRARETGDTAALQHAGLRAQKLMEDADASPFKGLLGPLVQMPIALSFFFGIRNMCNAGFPALKTGGLGWFMDLTVPDPTWVLPIMSSASMMLLLESSTPSNATGAAAHTRNFFRVLSILTIPIVAYLPSGVLVYFVVNGAFMLIQNAVSKIPSVRRAYGMLDPPTPPPGATITKSPTFVDSLRALRDGVKDAARKAREQQEAEARARTKAQKR